MSAKKRVKLGKIITSATKQIELWNTANRKALLQLDSIANMRGQLDSLPGESAPPWEIQSKLGALTNVPGLVPRLQATIVGSRERAYKFIQKELTIMGEVVECICRQYEQVESIYAELYEMEGYEKVHVRTHISFSTADIMEWFRHLKTLFYQEHQHKVHLLSTLVEADFTAMQQLIVNWNTPHAVRKIQEICELLHYNTNNDSLQTETV